MVGKSWSKNQPLKTNTFLKPKLHFKAMNDVYHYRQRKDAYFRDDPSSPVEDEAFEALRYYPVTRPVHRAG